MTAKQNIVINEILKGATITEACQTAQIHRTTYYKWLDDKTFTDELKSRKQAILNDCVQYMRSHFKTASEELVKLIEAPDTASQVRINAIDSFFRNYKAVAEEDALMKLEEIELKLKRLEGEENEIDGQNQTGQ